MINESCLSDKPEWQEELLNLLDAHWFPWWRLVRLSQRHECSTAKRVWLQCAWAVAWKKSARWFGKHDALGWSQLHRLTCHSYEEVETRCEWREVVRVQVSSALLKGRRCHAVLVKFIAPEYWRSKPLLYQKRICIMSIYCYDLVQISFWSGELCYLLM